MRSALVLTLPAAVLWALVLVVGFAGIDGVRSQNVPGYPSDGQLRYYIYLPLSVLALVASTWALSRRHRFLRALAGAVALVSLLCLPYYLQYYTGGV
jgi:hypothetical protein